MNNKLTEREADILKRLKEGVIAHYMRYMGRFNPNPYWFMSDNYKRCTAQIKGLEKKGYITLKSKGAFSEGREIIINGEKPIPVKAISAETDNKTNEAEKP